MTTRHPSRIIGYTDESGRIGKDELFFFASLWCEKTVHERMAETIVQIRASRNFWNVMHFSEMSNLRATVYQEVASALAGIPGWTMRVLIYEKRYDAHGKPYDFAHYGRRDEVSTLKKARAYNKLLRDHLSSVVRYCPSDFWQLYIEDRHRSRDDNGKDYIRLALQSYYVRTVEFVPKQHHDLLQVIDIFLGAYAFSMYSKRGIRPKQPPGTRKQEVAETIEAEIRSHCVAPWFWQAR